jgi:hypothetical protein
MLGKVTSSREPGADLQQARYPAVELQQAGGRFRDAGEHFQQRVLAGAVAADDADDFARTHFKADVLEGPDGGGIVGKPRGAGTGPKGSQAAERSGHGVHHALAQRGGRPDPPDEILLAEVTVTVSRWFSWNGSGSQGRSTPF